MNLCQVKAIKAEFHPGTLLELTPDQAGPRLHNLCAMGEGLFEVVRPVEFRQGECLGIDGTIPLALLALLEMETSLPLQLPTPASSLPIAPPALPATFVAYDSPQFDRVVVAKKNKK